MLELRSWEQDLCRNTSLKGRRCLAYGYGECKLLGKKLFNKLWRLHHFFFWSKCRTYKSSQEGPGLLSLRLAVTTRKTWCMSRRVNYRQINWKAEAESGSSWPYRWQVNLPLKCQWVVVLGVLCIDSYYRIYPISIGCIYV